MSWIHGFFNGLSAVLLNKSPSDEFPLLIGFSQCDPQSSFYIIIAMEVLHMAMEDVVAAGAIRGAPLGMDNLVISLLFYVVDDLF